ncbi:cysteine-type peptidase [Arabidopsis lyrata subsp. lyrata]|uniref:Cysteine-type peptidase n=1 Tax=Arabidopsis lyrata subsp. lyrata TaxID=81972 RepID=D7LRX1_ARALL|nr:cysteine-type peptidase [Arabidopsis lyrata subsp. lyrata]
MSRRRSNRVRNTNSKYVTSPVRVTIIDDCEEDEFLHHRTCWKHIAAALNKCGSKPKRAKELEIFKLSAPCFYDECTRRGRFVLDIYRAEGRTEDPRLVDEIPFHVPVVPQQTNDVECGSFVLYYIQRFIEDAPENFSVDDMPYFMKEDWFSHKELEEFCETLHSLGTIH